MKKLWTLVLTLLIALSSLTVLAREAEEPQTDVEVLSVTAIAETLEEGQKLTGAVHRVFRAFRRPAQL